MCARRMCKVLLDTHSTITYASICVFQNRLEPDISTGNMKAVEKRKTPV